MGRFSGQVVIVTGAASGIGLATARRFADEGAQIVIADIDGAAAAASASALSDGGMEAVALAVDVADEASMAELVRVVVAEHGTIDVLVNNAALMRTDSPDADIASLDVTVWDAKMAVNARGAMLGCKHVVPVMRAARRGAIVNLASVSGLVGTDVNAAYGSSKAAISGLTRYVATMVGADGIRCNAVAPGLVLTDRIRSTMSADQLEAYRAERLLPWAADPADIASTVAWLASDEARCVTGQTIVVDCGTTTHRPRHAMAQWANRGE